MTLDGLLIVVLIVAMLVARHTNRQRVLARRNGQEVLAATQPIAHENALPLPTTIELRVSKTKYILFQAVFYGLVLTIYMTLANSQDPFSLRRFLLTFLISLLAGVLFGLLIFYVSGRQMGQTLVVDDQGISILYSRGNRHIDWQAAQFFGVHYDRKSHTTGLYELSNETTTVTWRWFPPIIANPFNFLSSLFPMMNIRTKWRRCSLSSKAEPISHSTTSTPTHNTEGDLLCVEGEYPGDNNDLSLL